MRRNCFLIVLACLFFVAYGQAGATNFSAKISPESGPDTVIFGTPFTIDIYGYNNTGEITAISMPFKIYSPDGSIANVVHRKTQGFDVYDGRILDSIYYDSSIVESNSWGTPWVIFHQYFGFSWDGSLPDTLNGTFAGISGWKTTTSATKYISVALNASQPGTICIDSCSVPEVVPPGKYDWLFFGPPDVPFNGPYCFTIFDPNANRPPVLNPIGSKSTNEGELLTFGVSATDPDGDIPTLTTSALPASALFVDNANGAGTFNWTPNFLQSGTYLITFFASDGELKDSEVVTITVGNINQPPVQADIGNKSVNENELLTFQVIATDPDGTIPTLTSSTLPTGATYKSAGAGKKTFSWTPTYDQADDYPITFYASDGTLKDSEVVTITVVDMNRPPVIAVIGDKSINANELLTFGVTATDPDGATPALSAAPLPAGASFIDNGGGNGTFNWTPTSGQVGAHPIYFYASDGGLKDSQLVTITVVAVNRPPVLDQIAVGPQSVLEGDTLVLDVHATDPDGTTPILLAENLMLNATFQDYGNGSGIFIFRPDFSQTGDYFVRFIATDNQLADTEVVAIIVNNVEPPNQLAVDHSSYDFILPPSSSTQDSIYVYEMHGRNVQFEITNNSTWLLLPVFYVPPSTPAMITFGVNSAGLAAGDYYDTIFVEGFPTTGSIITVPVKLTVVGEEPPCLAVNPNPIDFYINACAPVLSANTANIIISNCGSGTLNWKINGPEWFDFSETEGIGNDTVTVSMKPYYISLLADSLFPYMKDSIATIVSSTIEADGAINSPVYMNYRITIYCNAGNAALATQPDAFEYYLNLGDSIIYDSLSVFETSGRKLDFWVYQTTWSPANWLEVDTMEATPLLTPELIYVNIRTAALTPGDYIDTIVIDSRRATNNPLKLPVTLHVTAPLVVKTAPTSFNFLLAQDQTKSESLYVFEQYGRTTFFLAEHREGWLSVYSPADPPFQTPKSFVITANSAGLAPGFYADTIWIAPAVDSPGVDSSVFPTVAVPVNLTVTEFNAVWIASPEIMWFTTYPGGSAGSQLCYISEQSGAHLNFATRVQTGEWLRIVPIFEPYITPDSVFVTIGNTAGMAPGDYSDTIFIVDTGEGVVKYLEIPVNLTIKPFPVLHANPGHFEFTLAENDPAAFAHTLITDEFFSNVPFNASLMLNDGWIILYSSPDSQWVTPDTIRFLVTPNIMPVGSYSDTLLITYPYPYIDDTIIGNNELKIPIVLHVTPAQAYEFVTMPKSLSWVVDEGGHGWDSLYVYEAHDRQIGFLANNSQSWLTVMWSEIPNFRTPASVPLYYDAYMLPPGIYHDTLVIISDDYGVPVMPVKVPVTLMVRGAGVEEDSLWISTVPGVPGNDVIVPIYFRNFEPLKTIHLAMVWNSDEVTLNNITFDGTRVEYVDSKPIAIDNDTWHAELAVIPTFTPDVPIGRGLLAKLHFTVKQSATGAFVMIDTSSYFNGHGLSFVDDQLNIIIPTFIPGGIVIDTSAGFVCGRVIDTYGNEIEGATVELWDNFPGGGMMQSELTDFNGQFACHTTGITPFDAYAYKEGYYPGLVEDIQFGETGIEIVLTPVPPITPTPEWVNFYCDNNYFYGVPLPVGSVVDAYDPDGAHCGTFFVTEPGKYGFMPVYRDDPYSDYDEGAEPGDTITFFINGYPANADGYRVWTEKGASFQVCLDIFRIEDRSIALSEGWNLISWNVDTPDDNIDSILASISDCVEVVLGFEQGGFTFDPILPEFSTLWNADHLHGYWVKMSCPDTLVVKGVPVAATTPIHLETGWNLVSYLPDVEDSTPYALNSIIENLIVALGFDGDAQTYDPKLPDYSTMPLMKPGFGYWLKVNSDDMLVYPGIGPEMLFRQTPTMVAKAASISPVTSRLWMNVYSHELMFDGHVVMPGAEIKATAAGGRVVGTGVIGENGKFGFMPIYGDDPATSEKEGLAPNEEFMLVIDGAQTKETFVWNGVGSKLEISSLTSKPGGDLLPTEFSLAQNYPNPFNPLTTISFSVPYSTTATVDIYNILGKKVRTIFSGMAQAGRNDVVWDGTDSNDQPVASGIYFYRMKAGDFEQSRKMVLMK